MKSIVIYDFENEYERTNGIKAEFNTYGEALRYAKELREDPYCYNIDVFQGVEDNEF